MKLIALLVLLLASCQGMVSHSGHKKIVVIGSNQANTEFFLIDERIWLEQGGQELLTAYKKEVQVLPASSSAGQKRDALRDWLFDKEAIHGLALHPLEQARNESKVKADPNGKFRVELTDHATHCIAISNGEIRVIRFIPGRKPLLELDF